MTGRPDGFAAAVEMLGALRARRVSAAELLRLHLDRIERHNPRVNALVIPDFEAAGRAAEAADAARARGEDAPLLGLPFTVKDAVEVAGLRATAGVPEHAGRVSTATAPVAARALGAGGILLGKTNIPPWAQDWQADNAVFGRTNNPWDLDRTPGGSTGGGAAAVAAGLTPLEFGSDLGGSVRVPAAWCGVYGHRPSETAVPRSGHFPGASAPNTAFTLGVLGPLARSAEDLELALDVVVGPGAGRGGRVAPRPAPGPSGWPTCAWPFSRPSTGCRCGPNCGRRRKTSPRSWRTLGRGWAWRGRRGSTT